jgi:hypothetical protein
VRSNVGRRSLAAVEDAAGKSFKVDRLHLFFPFS